MIAALFFRCVDKCRSRQLYEMLIFPPTNHFANGGLFQSSSVSHFLNHVSSDAIRGQNVSGDASDSLYSASYSAIVLMCACFVNSAGGGKRRRSVRMDSMFFSVMAC